MKRARIIIPLLIFLFACQEEVEKRDFFISIENFELRDTLLNDHEKVPEIEHKFAGGNVKFSNGSKIHLFETNNIGIEDYVFSLPDGEYLLEIEIPPASLYGQQRASFMLEPEYIEISNSVDTISINAEPSCALIVVSDKKNHLENGSYIIKRHEYSGGYFTPYPLTLDSMERCYYTYITPDTATETPSAYLWFYDKKPGEETGGLSTKDLEIGYRYLIKVLE